MNQQIPVMKLILSKVTLQVFERNKKDSTLAEAANWEVVLSGRLEIKIWKDSSTAAICLRGTDSAEKIQQIQLQSSEEIKRDSDFISTKSGFKA